MFKKRGWRGKPVVALMFLRRCPVDIKSFAIEQLYNFSSFMERSSIVFASSGKALCCACTLTNHDHF